MRSSSGSGKRISVQVAVAMQQVGKSKLLADLHGVDVYAEGVDGAGESVGYWQSLHDFWVAYFAKAGATVARYSVLRDVPNFEQLLTTTAESREK